MLGVLLSVSAGSELWNELQPSNQSDQPDAVDCSTEMTLFRNRITLFPRFTFGAATYRFEEAPAAWLLT